MRNRFRDFTDNKPHACKTHMKMYKHYEDDKRMNDDNINTIKCFKDR